MTRQPFPQQLQPPPVPEVETIGSDVKGEENDGEEGEKEDGDESNASGDGGYGKDDDMKRHE